MMWGVKRLHRWHGGQGGAHHVVGEGGVVGVHGGAGHGRHGGLHRVDVVHGPGEVGEGPRHGGGAVVLVELVRKHFSDHFHPQVSPGHIVWFPCFLETF